MPGQFFYYTDTDGDRQDADIHEAVLDNPLADLFFMLTTIRQHVDEGHDFAEAVELFGNDQLRAAHTDGKLTLDDIDVALNPDEEG